MADMTSIAPHDTPCGAPTVNDSAAVSIAVAAPAAESPAAAPGQPSSAAGGATTPPRKRIRRPGAIKPDSIRQQLARALIAATRAHGTAVTVAQWRTAADEAGAPLHDFHGKVGNLLRGGVAVRVTGRNSWTQYRHAEHPVPPAPDRDPAMIIHQITLELCTTLARAVSTEEINTAARQRVPAAVPRDGCVQLLDALSSRSWTREDGQRVALLERVPVARVGGTPVALAPSTGVADGNVPPVVDVAALVAVKASRGRPRLYWRPIGSPLPLPGEPPTRPAALRHVVGVVTAALGRPASPEELRLWCVAHRHVDPAAMRFYSATNLSEVLRDAARTRRRLWLRLGTATTLVRIKGPFSCHAGAPIRMGLAEPTRDARAAMAVWDLCLALRPADEVALIRAAEALGMAVASPVFNHIAALRRVLLPQVVARYQPSEVQSGGWVTEGAAAAHRQADLLSGWSNADSGTLYRRYKFTKELDDLRRHLDVLLTLEDERVLATDPMENAPAVTRSCRCVGEALTMESAQVEGFRRAVIQQFGKSRRESHRTFTTARRFPNRDRPRAPQACVDRVDFALALWDAAHVARATDLLREARTLLGTVLRDVSVLRQVLAAAPAHDMVGRRALIVALGLLGTTLPPEDAVVDLESPMAVAAACLAAVAADPDAPLPALSAIEEFVVAHGASDEVVAVAMTAVCRAADGLLTSVVEP